MSNYVHVKSTVISTQVKAMMFLVAIAGAMTSVVVGVWARDLIATSPAIAFAQVAASGIALGFILALSKALQLLLPIAVRRVAISFAWGGLMAGFILWVEPINLWLSPYVEKGGFWAIAPVFAAFAVWSILFSFVLRAFFGKREVDAHWEYVDKVYRTWR
jgi:hypothetical protein